MNRYLILSSKELISVFLFQCQCCNNMFGVYISSPMLFLAESRAIMPLSSSVISYLISQNTLFQFNKSSLNCQSNHSRKRDSPSHRLARSNLSIKAKESYKNKFRDTSWNTFLQCVQKSRKPQTSSHCSPLNLP